MSLSENDRRALLNMTGEGFTGPYPIPDGDLANTPDLRHLLGLYRFENLVFTPLPALIAEDGDIFMKFSPLIGTEIFIDKKDLVRDKGLRTAVLISLFSDRIAEETDVLPDNSGERKGWCLDPSMGSRLWLLFRASLTPDIPSRIEFYSKEALEWMITDGVASDILVKAEITGLNIVEWIIEIIKPGQKNNSLFKFFFNWENELFGEVEV